MDGFGIHFLIFLFKCTKLQFFTCNVLIIKNNTVKLKKNDDKKFLVIYYVAKRDILPVSFF